MCASGPHSDPSPQTSALILGAGLAGLSAALSLVRRGWSVTVLERDAEVGGLARTVRPGPQESFDLGGHRFFTGDAWLLSQGRRFETRSIAQDYRIERLLVGSFGLHGQPEGPVLFLQLLHYAIPCQVGWQAGGGDGGARRSLPQPSVLLLRQGHAP